VIHDAIREYVQKRACETAARLMADEARYGFAVVGEHGERVDPREMLHGESRRIADFYAEPTGAKLAADFAHAVECIERQPYGPTERVELRMIDGRLRLVVVKP
jgi:hypothetical protein